MAGDLGSSQISALLESVPGIANVLRSPVADAIVNMIRAGAGVEPFHYEDADELVQYAVRRGLIGAEEGERVLGEARSARRGGRKSAAGSAKKTGARRAKAKAAPKKVRVRGAPAKKRATRVKRR